MSKRPAYSFFGGIHPPMHKEESNGRPIDTMPLAQRYVLPLHQNIGQPAKPEVEVGDRVLKGQRVGHADGYVSVALHAPTSGIIRQIGPHAVPHPSGLHDNCIIIESDGEDKWGERHPLPNYEEINPSHLRNIIRDAGIVGLGGAGFPSFIKLNPGTHKKVETLIINGIECEPYITCDDLLMRERADDIVAGIRIIRHALQAVRVLIAIEDNKPEAIRTMDAAVRGEPSIEVIACPTRYPQGSEKQLVEALTGKEVPSNGLPLNIGIVVHNIGTAEAIYRAITHGEPLISRVVTVTGGGVAAPRNVQARIGTVISDLLRYCEGPSADTRKLIMGGPMMGFTLHDDSAPIVKTTNCLLAVTTNEWPARGPVMPCIRCGACADACPARLLPQQLFWYAQAKDFDKVQEFNLFDCIECGCCAYVCPSDIPLVHFYRYAKTEIWSREREKTKADIARERHESRQSRLEREKQERAARHKKKREELTAAAPNKDAEPSTKKTAILAAMERSKQKKEAAGITPANTDALSEHQKQLIDEVDQRRQRTQHPETERTAAAADKKI